MIKHSIEWNEILGDAIEDTKESEVREAMADEQELTGADLDDWYASLIDEELRQEEEQVWNEFWNDKDLI